jgi:hypothetical protein
MKKNIFQICRSLMTLILVLAIAIHSKSQNCNFSKVVDQKSFNLSQLESKWETYAKDPGFKILLDAVTKQGFTRIAKNEKAAWGFGGEFISDSVLGTSAQDAEVCSFDFYKKTATGVQMCSMVWRKVGGTTYKAYILFPPGEKDFNTAMEKSSEFYVDENNKVQRAHSFGKCWAKCVFKRFNATNCATAMAACGGAAAGLVIAGIGVTTPIALGIFGVCAGVFCLGPLAICAAYCL